MSHNKKNLKDLQSWESLPAGTASPCRRHLHGGSRCACPERHEHLNCKDKRNERGELSLPMWVDRPLDLHGGSVLVRLCSPGPVQKTRRSSWRMKIPTMAWVTPPHPKAGASEKSHGHLELVAVHTGHTCLQVGLEHHLAPRPDVALVHKAQVLKRRQAKASNSKRGAPRRACGGHATMPPERTARTSLSLSEPLEPLDPLSLRQAKRTTTCGPVLSCTSPLPCREIFSTGRPS